MRSGGSHFCQRDWLWRLEAAFSWQSQKLVVGSRGGGSHCTPTCWLCGGEATVLMAVPDAGCGGGEAVVLFVFPIAGCGGGALVLSAVSDTGCGG